MRRRAPFVAVLLLILARSASISPACGADAAHGSNAADATCRGDRCPGEGCAADDPLVAVRGAIAPRSEPDGGAAVERPPSPEYLAFDLEEGAVRNRFVRQGPVAVHLVASWTDEGRGRLVFAFPAGNSGGAIWLDGEPCPGREAGLEFEGEAIPVSDRSGNGVSTELVARVPRLVFTGQVLGSVRDVRERTEGDRRKRPARFPADSGGRLVHVAADGRSRVEAVVEPVGGARWTTDRLGRPALVAPPGACAVRFRITARTDERPLTSLPIDELLAAGVAGSAQERQALAFLAYREKLLAGSWRFQTYFGRDTLLATRLLMPALRPAAIEAALGSVIDRLGDDGQVAHEEEIGERAEPTSRAPRHDYKMVDSDFLLAPVLEAYLATAEGRARAGAFFARRTPTGRTYAEAVRRNLARVAAKAEPFAENPLPTNLIRLADGEPAGDWRDSREGLGGGRYPFSVNGVLVPAALDAAARLVDRGHAPFDASRFRALARRWRGAAELFRVTLPAETAAGRIAAYAEEVGLDPAAARAAIDGPVSFLGVSLDGDGVPIPIVHSDGGLSLLFGEPSPPALEEMADRVTTDFPAGLASPVGMMVANPAFADAALRRLFTPGHYHGAVVWSWQHALMAAGLDRQLARGDLPASTRERLLAARRVIREAIERTRDRRGSELWSWTVEDGAMRPAPFGQASTDKTESNAIQLWSLVYLGL